jgi:hypothetical protein
MSEKTLAELVEMRLEIDAWRAYKHEQKPWIAMFDARIARSEAAERFAEFAAIHHETGATEDVCEAAERLLREYMAAREAVRKMEEGT